MAVISPPCCDPEVPVDATTVTEEVGQRDESSLPSRPTSSPTTSAVCAGDFSLAGCLPG